MLKKGLPHSIDHNFGSTANAYLSYSSPTFVAYVKPFVHGS